MVPPQNNIDISNLLGLSPDSTWIIYYDKNSYRYFLRHQARGNITDYDTPNADPIAQLEFLAYDNIWAVCEWGQIIRFDGTSWRLIPSPTFAHITSISMANDSCSWAGGKYRNLGFLLHWNGKQWQVKMQQKNLVLRVTMVNDTLGWGFLEDDSRIIRLTHDQWNLVPFASSIQDTIVAPWQDIACPIFFNNKGIVTIGGITSHVTYANRPRDILWFTTSPEKSDTKIYLWTHDDKVSCVRRQFYSGNMLRILSKELIRNMASRLAILIAMAMMISAPVILPIKITFYCSMAIGKLKSATIADAVA